MEGWTRAGWVVAGAMLAISTGVAQKVKEFTVTGEYKMSSWLMSRLEFRHDWSNQPYFQQGSGFAKSQPTILLGMVAFLGPKK